jgi:Cu(I)/Ag(I) efflux system membrane fusion protein
MVLVVVFFVVGSGVGFWIGSSMAPEGPPEVSETYYCSMHSHIRLPHPGKCSICGMDLVLLRPSSTEQIGAWELEVSDLAMKLAEIETAKVKRRPVAAEIRMVGTIEFDETRVKTITAWVPGRLDRLFVDYTGIPVNKGDHLADIYSPKLFAAQQELIEAIKAVAKLANSDSEFVRASTLGTLEAVRDKLRLFGLTEEQVEEIERREKPSDHTLISASLGGIVVSKFADEGEYVQTGSPIYKIAELSHLWVKLDAYESDLAWLRYGQDVEFYTESYPGEPFRGKISFIDWVVDRSTRTAKVRVNVGNPDLKLKPGMFVRAEVRSDLTGGGRVLNPALKGKWISPMHPEIVKDGPGACDICGMDLVPAEKLFSSRDESAEPALVIPVSAALVTGRRAVVYVKLPGRKKPTFQGREVVLGPRAGDHYVVLSGLDENEEVVVRGNFKIDSALQIEAKPSMMNPEGGGAGHQHGDHDRTVDEKPRMSMASMNALESSAEFQATLTRLRDAYFQVGRALATDNFRRAKIDFAQFGNILAEVPAGDLGEESRTAWKDLTRTGKKEVILAATAANIALLRESFRKLSRMMLHAEHRFGHRDGAVFYEAFCPMAFDGKGDFWLQGDKTIANPYFGSAMLRCGEIRNEFASRPSGLYLPSEEEKPAEHGKGGHSHE